MHKRYLLRHVDFMVLFNRMPSQNCENVCISAKNQMPGRGKRPSRPRKRADRKSGEETEMELPRFRGYFTSFLGGGIQGDYEKVSGFRVKPGMTTGSVHGRIEKVQDDVPKEAIAINVFRATLPYSCIKYGAGGLKKIRNTALSLVETAPGRRSV